MNKFQTTAMYLDARLIGIEPHPTEAEEKILVFQYQGQEMRRNTRIGALTDTSLIDQIGAIKEQGFGFNHDFVAYEDQSLRRVYELDNYPAISRHEPAKRNPPTVGWRCDDRPGGFLAPSGVIPGANGEYIRDDAEAVTIQVPQEFLKLCEHYKQTPADVLAGFMADAAQLRNCRALPRADRLNSHGSSEEQMASDYLDRTYAMWVGRDD